jgi:uncharacterized linocin/CFP29 family protein
MANPGQDKLAAYWGPEIWKRINDAVDEEVGRVRVAGKIFKVQPYPGQSSITDDSENPDGSITEGKTKTVVEFSAPFPLTQGQVENEASLGNAVTNSRRKARTLMLFEDVVILQGKGAFDAKGFIKEPGQDKITVSQPGALDEGLVYKPFRGTRPGNGDPGDPEEPKNWHEDRDNFVRIKSHFADDVGKDGVIWGDGTFIGVVKGIAKLNAKGHPGPYALILPPRVYADTYTQGTNRLTTVADQIKPLVTGGFVQSGSLPVEKLPAGGDGDQFGLLVSLGGDPVVIGVAQDPVTGYLSQDEGGNHNFRVVERFAVVAREPDALVRLEFQYPPPP